MDLTIIAAVARNNVIGNNNEIPWHYKEDMKRFRDLTLCHPVIMGRRTFDSLSPPYQPLPGRLNIVLSTKGDYNPLPFNRELVIAHSTVEALEVAGKNQGKNGAFVIGGARVYEQFMPKATKLEITEINRDFQGDTFFPEIDQKIWQQINRAKGITEELYFVTYKRL